MLTLDADTELRPFTEADAPELFRLTDANRARLREWLPWLDRNTTEADSLAFIRFATDEARAEKQLILGIFHKNRLAGTVGFNAIDNANDIAKIGYWIGEHAAKQGLITRACAALTEHAFKTMGMNRVEIRCATGNLASQAVPERLGFQLEGVFRQCEFLYDRFVDHRIYARIKSDG